MLRILLIISELGIFSLKTRKPKCHIDMTSYICTHRYTHTYMSTDDYENFWSVLTEESMFNYCIAS